MNLLIRSWNNTPISRRSTDGYVNATAMAKASGKEWAGYFRTDRATTYMEALSRNCRITVTDLYLAKPGDGTWIHPRLAVDFARWISADFAVWMDSWFLESTQSTPVAPPQLTPADVIGLLERTVSFFDTLGGVDERDQLLFKDLARNQLLKISGGVVPLPANDEELAISDAWQEVFGVVLPRDHYQKVGRLIAREYKSEFGVKPPKRTQFVDGAARQVNSYKRNWLINTLQRIKEEHFA